MDNLFVARSKTKPCKSGKCNFGGIWLRKNIVGIFDHNNLNPETPNASQRNGKKKAFTQQDSIETGDKAMETMQKHNRQLKRKARV